MANLSRRGFLRGSAAAGVAATTPTAAADPAVAAAGAPAPTGARPSGSGDLILVNGRIRTMDGRGTVASSLTIRDGRIRGVGGPGGHGPDDRVIDLRGRTVIPGLIDNHNHIVLLGLRPGHDVRLERAASVAEVQAALRAAARRVPAGEFLTAIGGWNPVQFAEGRLPTLAELDRATTDHPVYLQVAFAGPGAANSAGRRFFEAAGIPVGDDGSLAGGAAPNPATRALAALRARQSFDDQVRGTRAALAYGLGLGVTTHLDMGGFIATGTAADGAAHFDPFTAYDPFLALHRQRGLDARLRVFFLSMDSEPDVPMLSQRVRNAFREFGDDMMKASGLGEFITVWPLFGGPDPTNYDAAVRLAAGRGWIYQQHSLSLREDQLATAAWERLDADLDIGDLHWSVAHVPFIDRPTVERLRAIGAGVAVHGWRYLAGTPTANGPPYRMIVDSGIHVGAGSDSAQISPLNPWLNLYYMVTGRNSSGVLINAGQTLGREEALRLWTRENGWFSKEERDLGSIETGKLADLVVLSADYFDPRKVPDEAIKAISSVLTIVQGRIVHDAGVLGHRRPQSAGP